MYELIFTRQADADLRELEEDPSKVAILKAVRKTLGLMETNLRHPSLNTHEFKSLKGPNGKKVFEAYVQQRTPGAFRVFWYYGPGKGTDHHRRHSPPSISLSISCLQNGRFVYNN